MGALDGLKVTDLSRLLPGPFCTGLLADHGAEVIVVEAPRFRDDPVLGNVPMVRRNKRHMALDLKSRAGREIFFQLIAEADVLVEGFRPGVTKRLGADYESIRALNPGIIYCSLTGYGQEGPLAQRAGHDLNYMAAAGILDLGRDKDGGPVMPNFQMADLAGSLYAVVGILLALAAREKTGKGQYLDVSMTDGLVSLLAVPLSFAFTGARLPGRLDNAGNESFPCYRVYRTRDGEYLSVGPLEPHLWESLCAKLGCPQFADGQYDESRKAEVTTHLEELFAGRNLAEWVEILNDPNDCTAPVTRVSKLPDDAHFLARGMIHRHPDGIFSPGISPKLSETPGEYRRDAYRFGQHTREILGELGYAPVEIAALEKEGVAWSDSTPV
jgi:crotonobetainyl-CoA:carnitine CoA-transferase CaiB-like acyl-CoA transferase